MTTENRKEIRAKLKVIEGMVDEYAFDYNIKTMTEKTVNEFVDRIEKHLGYIRLYSKPCKRIKKKCKI